MEEFYNKYYIIYKEYIIAIKEFSIKTLLSSLKDRHCSKSP